LSLSVCGVCGRVHQPIPLSYVYPNMSLHPFPIAFCRRPFIFSGLYLSVMAFGTLVPFVMAFGTLGRSRLGG